MNSKIRVLTANGTRLKWLRFRLPVDFPDFVHTSKNGYFFSETNHWCFVDQEKTILATDDGWIYLNLHFGWRCGHVYGIGFEDGNIKINRIC